MDPSLSLCPTLGHNASTIPNNACPPPIKGLFWVVICLASGVMKKIQYQYWYCNTFLHWDKQAQVMIVATMRSFMKAKMKWIIKSGRKFVEMCVKRLFVGTGCCPCWSRKLRYVFDIYFFLNLNNCDFGHLSEALREYMSKHWIFRQYRLITIHYEPSLPPGWIYCLPDLLEKLQNITEMENILLCLIFWREGGEGAPSADSEWVILTWLTLLSEVIVTQLSHWEMALAS